MTDNSHAIANAEGWLQNIRDLVATMVASDWQDDEARRSIDESPLSVQVRNGWHTPGAAEPASEYEVLLSTGGPALRITGSLDDVGEPSEADLQWQDWGTPWTSYALGSEEAESVLAFVRCFYYGGGEVQ